MHKLITITTLLGLTLGSLAAQTAKPSSPTVTLNAIGGSFPKALYASWFNTYQGITGVQVTYQPLGSGEGIRAIQSQTVDFGASDAAMSDKQLSQTHGGEILHIPTAFGGIVLSYNLPGLSETLKLRPETIAGMYLGDIQWWDDSRLMADNPGLAGKHFPVIVVHRADGSGTTAGFTQYLSVVSETWKNRAGSGTAVFWPRGAGAIGNDGIARTVQENPYSIGYIEQGFAVAKSLPSAQVQNRAGHFIAASIDSVSAAAAAATIGSGKDLRLDAVNTAGKDAYPIVTGTYVLVYKNQTDARKGQAVVGMLKWAMHEGQKSNRSLYFAPVPDQLVSRVDALLASMTINGQPLN